MQLSSVCQTLNAMSIPYLSYSLTRLTQASCATLKPVQLVYLQGALLEAKYSSSQLQPKQSYFTELGQSYQITDACLIY